MTGVRWICYFIIFPLRLCAQNLSQCDNSQTKQCSWSVRCLFYQNACPITPGIMQHFSYNNDYGASGILWVRMITSFLYDRINLVIAQIECVVDEITVPVRSLLVVPVDDIRGIPLKKAPLEKNLT